jgi:hypothetical protein
MTKNWDAVRGYIEEYSVTQKMSLEDVMAMMQRKHSFKASTRAYRLKYKEWGFLRHKPHRSRRMGESARRVQASDGGLSDSTYVSNYVSRFASKTSLSGHLSAAESGDMQSTQLPNPTSTLTTWIGRGSSFFKLYALATYWN